jgi:predicted alpha/beta-hydrolase family hydrolase
MERSTHRFLASDSCGKVSAVLLRPEEAWALLVFGHGAGAGMEHPFMQAVAERLGLHGVASFRYQFPYMEQGRKRPDHARRLTDTVRSAVANAHALAGDLPLIAGGKSMGGRMTSQAWAAEPLPAVAGLVFFGFPLHSPAKPGMERADHLSGVAIPMLFLQGTRDTLARMDLVGPLCERLGARATLHVVDGADHGFHVLKRSGRTDEEVLDELAGVTTRWMRHVLGRAN